MRKVGALLAFEVHMEKSFVTTSGNRLSSYSWKRRATEILDKPKIRLESKAVDCPIVAFGIAIFRNMPNLTHRLNRSGYAKLGKYRSQQQHVKGNLRFVEGARCAGCLDIDDREMQTGRANFSSDQVSKAPT
jgi:hypothetical protein